MNFVGIDLHKKTISLCVVDQERNVLDRKRFYCRELDSWQAAGFALARTRRAIPSPTRLTGG